MGEYICKEIENNLFETKIYSMHCILAKTN